MAQLSVNISPTPEVLVNSLVGKGIKISNVKFTGAPNARGTFNGTSSNIGIKSGVLLSTGYATNATGPNNDPTGGSCYVIDILKSYDFGRPGDSDLNKLQGCTDCTHDATVLEFDFIPESSPLSFRYVFASEEYPCYVCSKFNDVFAFFLSGPNPAGGNYNKKNIATIPNTVVPVAINSVNSGTPGYDPIGGQYYPKSDCISLSYSSYFVNNGDGSNPTANKTVQYNGFTKVLTATADVEPCKTYHIKLSLADVSDGKYDSGVFLEESSFQSASAVSITTSFSKPQVDNIAAVEGCDDANVCFKIEKAQSEDIVIPLNYKGSTADTTGNDLNDLPKSVTIQKGQTQACITISPLKDAINENTEKIVVNAKTSACGWNNVTVDIKDNAGITVSTSDVTVCSGKSVEITGNPSGEYGSYTYVWSNNAGTAKTVTVSPSVTTTYSVTATDICSNSATADLVVTVNPNPVIEPFPQTNICIGSSATLTANVPGTTSPVYFWSNGSTDQTIVVSPAETMSYTVSVTDANSCVSSATGVVNVLPYPKLLIEPYKPDICLGNSVTLSVSGADTYKWSPSDGLNTSTGSTVIASPVNSVTYTVTGTNGNLCRKDTALAVDIISLDKSYTVNPDPASGNSPLTVKFSYKGTENDIKWNFGDNTQSFSKDTSHVFNYNALNSVNGVTTYKVKLIIKNGDCIDTVIINIDVKLEIYIKAIPDILTPNDDNKNDVFYVEGNGLKSAEITIFSRWGKKLFSENLDFSSNAGTSVVKKYELWTGVDNNKKEVPAGVYFYIIRFVGIDGNEVKPREGKLNGTVTLVK